MGCGAAVQKASLEQLSGLAWRNGPVTDAAGSRFDFDKRLKPEEAARSGANELDLEAATARLVANRVRDKIRADGERRRIRGDENPDGHCDFALRCGDDRVDPIVVQAADRRPVKQGGGGKGAIAKAVNGFDVEAGMVVRVVDFDPVTEFEDAKRDLRSPWTDRIRRGKASTPGRQPASGGSRGKS